MAEENSEKTLDDKKYQTPEVNGKPLSNMPNAPTPQQEKQMVETRKKLDQIKKFIITKYKFVQAIGIIPPQAAEIFDEENELNEEEKKKKPMHLLVILPSKKEKEFNSIKAEIIKKIKESKENIWLNLFLEQDLWEICMDSKYEVIEAIGMAFPLFDKGVLGSLRVAQIHKSLVLKKFEKYVYSYILGGSMIYRGGSSKTSEVDTYIIIDDTDVKRMPRMELKEKLRNIVYSYVMQARELAGVKNDLHVQVWLLTEFWDGVKDANPVFYTVLRDAIALYDRGGFLPWKLLLKMGKIKPSPESIDMFMSSGDKTKEMIKRKLMDIVINDIYWGVSMPTQGLLMLYGIPPTNAYETVKEFKRIFVDKEKLIDKKYADILENVIIKYYKGFDHGKIKEVSGKEVDKLLEDSADYLKKLKEIRQEIEKRMMQKTFKEIYDNVFKMMKSLFGNKSVSVLVKEYEKEIVNKGKGDPRFLHTLHELISLEKQYKAKKIPNKQIFEHTRKDSVYLIESLVEYGQKRDLGLLEKTKVVLTYKGKHSELFLTKPSFLVHGDKVKKIVGAKVVESDVNEFNKTLTEFKGEKANLDSEMLKVLKKELGEFSVII